MQAKEIVVLMGTCGKSAGADRVRVELEKQITAQGWSHVTVRQSGCAGLCYCEVNLKTFHGEDEVIYQRMTPEDVSAFLQAEIAENRVYADKLLRRGRKGDMGALYPGQQRVVLRDCGNIDPTSLDDYLRVGGYAAVRKAVTTMRPEDVVEEVKASGLRGRGGAGFPTGLKWELTRRNPAPEGRYFVCNADEGDPGAFMDRSVLEGNPHAVIEGMMIGAYAIGAKSGYIYCRAEYPLAVRNANKAILDCRERGILGKDIFGSGFSFDIKVKEGAGAFVCGEETALIASIEGKRGMPRLRPPFPAEKGIHGISTVINNVETLANLPWLVANGGATFGLVGYEKSRGTKIFALAGKIKNGGLVEVPMGTTLREVINDIGGGMVDPLYKFKAVQLGGPSGGCLPESLLDTRVDYEELNATGAIIGSGGMVVMDERSCMVDIARYFLNFTQAESCGKCTFCRVGTKRMLEILEAICDGRGTMDDLETLRHLAETSRTASLCGLGQTAANPILTTMRYFEDEYIAHIRDKRCPAKACKSLITYSIDAEKCVGCTACARVCPVGAITGERKTLHVINRDVCVKCGACLDTCKKFQAISVL